MELQIMHLRTHNFQTGYCCARNERLSEFAWAIPLFVWLCNFRPIHAIRLMKPLGRRPFQLIYPFVSFAINLILIIIIKLLWRMHCSDTQHNFKWNEIILKWFFDSTLRMKNWRLWREDHARRVFHMAGLGQRQSTEIMLIEQNNRTRCI